MALALVEQKYSSVRLADPDLENDSDTTLGSTILLEKNTKRRRRASNRPAPHSLLTWIRWTIVILLQSFIIFLLLRSSGTKGRKTSRWSPADTETGGDINGLYVPIGSGSVSIPDYANHPMLGKPITDDPIRSGPIFEASWTHALHCLYYSKDNYHQLLTNGTFGFGGERNDDHAAHCFEYLRNQILCMADMTLEGSESILDATGKGQAHMCRDREEAIAWIEERRVDDVQSIVGP
ncbi:hypothetical protein FKW77_003424 [Venturia effusa]|uniref:Uncharacterized protein n=1 Tax=Venturia effusa TaxID=50376 RepID=A0A517L717_9PEZI|nr:hypothetical protein FKW77_003424 [Venturia effusa]